MYSVLVSCLWGLFGLFVLHLSKCPTYSSGEVVVSSERACENSDVSVCINAWLTEKDGRVRVRGSSPLIENTL